MRVERRRLPLRWDARCSEILQRMAGRYHDREICASIAAETGKRFSAWTVAEYRRAGGLPAQRLDGAVEGAAAAVTGGSPVPDCRARHGRPNAPLKKSIFSLSASIAR